MVNMLFLMALMLNAISQRVYMDIKLNNAPKLYDNDITIPLSSK